MRAFLILVHSDRVFMNKKYKHKRVILLTILILASISIILSFYVLNPSYSSGDANLVKLSPTPFYTQAFDLAGASSDGGAKPMRLFDENHLCDPEHGNMFTPRTGSVLPYRQNRIYFRKSDSGAYSIVYDLGDNANLKKIWIYQSQSFIDSFKVYAGKWGEWKRVVNHLSSSSSRWYSFPVDVTTRYLKVSFHGTWYPNYGSANAPDIREMVLYGNWASGSPPKVPPQKFAGNYSPYKTLNGMAGTNIHGQVWKDLLSKDTIVRSYTLFEWDADKNDPYPNEVFNLDHFGNYAGGLHHMTEWAFADSIVKPQYNNNILFQSRRGSPGWIIAAGGLREDFPMDARNLNPDDPRSYKGSGSFYWNKAAAYGFTKVDTNLMKFRGAPKFTNRRTYKYYENGNEESGSWGLCDTCSAYYPTDKRYFTPVNTVAQSQADYDGWENRLDPVNKRIGMKNADPDSARLVMSGTVSLDTNRVLTEVWLSRQMRTDKKNIFKVLNFHYYPINLKHLNGASPVQMDIDTLRTIHPVQDSLAIKIELTVDFCRRIAPESEVWLSEIGYDVNKKSKYAAPDYPSFNPEEDQALSLEWVYVELASTHLDKFMIFEAVHSGQRDNPYNYLTSGKLYMDQTYQYRRLPSSYRLDGLHNILGKYRYEKTISYSWGGLYVKKFRHSQISDSVCYVFGKASHNGSSLKNQMIQVGSITGPANIYTLSFSDAIIGKGLSVSPDAKGNLIVMANETLQYAFVRERSR